MGAEVVRLADFLPAAETPRPFLARPNAVTPVVLVREASARPAHDNAAQPLDVFDQVAADAVDVGNLRLGTDPDAVIDDAADVLGELAVEGRLDGADGFL